MQDPNAEIGAAPVVVTPQVVSVTSKCPNCHAIVATPRGYHGKIQCGSCHRTFQILPVANVVMPGDKKKHVKVSSDWQSGLYSCHKDCCVCCCVGVV